MTLSALLLVCPTPFVAPAPDVTEPCSLEPHAVAASTASLEPLALVDHDGDGGTYLRLSGGFVTMQDSDSPDEDIEFNEGYLVALAIGQDMNDSASFDFGLELEAVWTDQDADDDGAIQAVRDVTFGGIFLNGIFDFRFTPRLGAYAGAGLGVAWIDVGTQSDAVNDFDSDEGALLAWQGRAGLKWNFSDDMSLNAGYRFIGNDDVEIDDDIGNASFDLETEQHVLELGLNFGI